MLRLALVGTMVFLGVCIAAAPLRIFSIDSGFRGGTDSMVSIG